MNRRNLLIGTAATAAVLPLTSSAFAQGAAIDEAKLHALMGGDFATATCQLALQKANHRAVKTFAELEIAEQAESPKRLALNQAPQASVRSTRR